MVGHLFCWISADVVSQYSDKKKNGAFSSPLWCTAGGGGGLYVLYVASGALLNYSPLQHCTPLRLSNEGGLSTRLEAISLHLNLLQMKENKNALHSGENRASAQHDSGLVWQFPAVFVWYMSVLNSASILWSLFLNYRAEWWPYVFIKNLYLSPKGTMRMM